MLGLDSRSQEDLLEKKIKLNETRIATKIQDLQDMQQNFQKDSESCSIGLLTGSERGVGIQSAH
jgi:hypothetical protein